MIGLRNIYMISVCLLSAILLFLITLGVLKEIYVKKSQVRSRVKKLYPTKKEISIRTIKEKQKHKEKSGLKKNKVFIELQKKLTSAGVMMRVEEFAILWIVISIVPSVLFAFVSKNIPGSITLAIMGAIIPPFYVNNKKKKKLEQFEDQLADALVIMCNCLRSGLTIQQAIVNIGKEMQDPLGKEFTLAYYETKYGSSVEKALNGITDRIDCEDLNLVVSAITIQRQVGGNLSEILETIAETIKGRLKLKNEIKVLTATGRTSGMIISLLPVGLAALLMLINTNYMMSMFTTSLGQTLLMVGVIMEGIGIMIVKKIVTIKY